MKILKTLGFVLLGVIVLALIIGLIQPTHYEIERSAEIDAPKEAIFAKINNLETWPSWSPFKEEDPTMTTQMGEKTVGLGASYSWDGEESGQGEMTVTEVEAPTFQKTALKFDGQDGGEGWFKLADGENGGTKTSWGWAMDVPYPMNSMMIFMAGKMERDMNRMFDRGLEKLKGIVESEKPTAPGYKVATVDSPARQYVGIRHKTSTDAINADFFAENYGKIMAAIGAMKAQPTGPASALYYDWNEETKTTDMAVVMPVAKPLNSRMPNIEDISIPAGKAYVIDYYGPYEGAGDAHWAMDAYLKKNKLKAGIPAIEEYITDPSTEPDQSKWLTKIIYLADGQMAEKQ